MSGLSGSGQDEAWPVELVIVDTDGLARFLAGQRAANGFLAADVAARMGTSAPALSMIENGRREPDIATLRRLLRALDPALRLVIARVPNHDGDEESEL